MRFLAALLLLAGCAAPDPMSVVSMDGASVTISEGTRSVRIVVVDEMPRGCEGKVGCAWYTHDPCEIYVFADTRFEVLGHELKHCFDGRFHS